MSVRVPGRRQALGHLVLPVVTGAAATAAFTSFVSGRAGTALTVAAVVLTIVVTVRRWRDSWVLTERGVRRRFPLGWRWSPWSDVRRIGLSPSGNGFRADVRVTTPQGLIEIRGEVGGGAADELADLAARHGRAIGWSSSLEDDLPDRIDPDEPAVIHVAGTEILRRRAKAAWYVLCAVAAVASTVIGRDDEPTRPVFDGDTAEVVQILSDAVAAESRQQALRAFDALDEPLISTDCSEPIPAPSDDVRFVRVVGPDGEFDVTRLAVRGAITDLPTMWRLTDLRDHPFTETFGEWVDPPEATDVYVQSSTGAVWFACT